MVFFWVTTSIILFCWGRDIFFLDGHLLPGATLWHCRKECIVKTFFFIFLLFFGSFFFPRSPISSDPSFKSSVSRCVCVCVWPCSPASTSFPTLQKAKCIYIIQRGGRGKFASFVKQIYTHTHTTDGFSRYGLTWRSTLRTCLARKRNPRITLNVRWWTYYGSRLNSWWAILRLRVKNKK